MVMMVFSKKSSSDSHQGKYVSPKQILDVFLLGDGLRIGIPWYSSPFNHHHQIWGKSNSKTCNQIWMDFFLVG